MFAYVCMCMRVYVYARVCVCVCVCVWEKEEREREREERRGERERERGTKGRHNLQISQGHFFLHFYILVFIWKEKKISTHFLKTKKNLRPKHLLDGVIPLSWDTIVVFYSHSRLGYSFEESYPSAEMQSMYSTATADWPIYEKY